MVIPDVGPSRDGDRSRFQRGRRRRASHVDLLRRPGPRGSARRLPAPARGRAARTGARAPPARRTRRRKRRVRGRHGLPLRSARADRGRRIVGGLPRRCATSARRSCTRSRSGRSSRAATRSTACSPPARQPARGSRSTRAAPRPRPSPRARRGCSSGSTSPSCTRPASTPCRPAPPRRPACPPPCASRGRARRPSGCSRSR